MAAPPESGCIGQCAAALEEYRKLLDVIVEVLRLAPADPDVQVMALPDAPRVAFEVAAEEQLGDSRGDVGAPAVERELRFLGYHGSRRISAPAYDARHRTEMAAGADHDRRFDRLVHDPRLACATQCLDGGAFHHPSPATLQQEVIELDATDRIAHDLGVRRVDERLANHAGTKRVDGLKRQAGAPVLLRIEFEQWEDFRRQPACAYLVARESRAVGHDDVPAVLPKDAGAGGSAGAAADDERVAASHLAARGASCGRWQRVGQGQPESSPP